jgi:hypothetical protein
VSSPERQRHAHLDSYASARIVDDSALAAAANGCAFQSCTCRFDRRLCSHIMRMKRDLYATKQSETSGGAIQHARRRLCSVLTLGCSGITAAATS